MWNPLKVLRRLFHTEEPDIPDDPRSVESSAAEYMDGDPAPSRRRSPRADTSDEGGLKDVLEVIEAADAETREFEPIKPPENLFEHVIEALAKFVARLAQIVIPEGITATQAVLEQIFGKPKSEANNPGTIGEAVSPFEPKGFRGRRGGMPGAVGKLGSKVVRSEEAEAADSESPSAAARDMTAASGAAAGGMTAVAMLGLLAVTASVIGAFRQLTSSAYKAAMRVSEFDAGIMGAKVQLQIGDLLREISSAHELSPAAQKNLEAENRLRQALHPYEVRMSEVGLNLGAWVKDKAAGFIESPMASLAPVFASIAGLALGMLQDIPMFTEAIKKYLSSLDDAAKKALGLMEDKDLKNMMAGAGQMPLHDFLLRPPPPPPPLKPPGKP